MNIGDTNEDGKLSATELGSLLSQIRALAPPEEGDVPRAPELFTLYDRDRSGFLEPLELVDLINDHLLGTITNIVAKTPRPVEVTFSRADPVAARAAQAYAETVLATVRAGCASTAAKVTSAEAVLDAALDRIAASGIAGVLLKTKKSGVVAARYFVAQSHYLLYKSSADSTEFSGGVDLTGLDSTIKLIKPGTAKAAIQLQGLAADDAQPAAAGVVPPRALRVLELRTRATRDANKDYSLAVWYAVLVKIQSALRAASTSGAAAAEALARGADVAAPEPPPPPAAPPSFPVAAKGAPAPSAVAPPPTPPSFPASTSAASPLKALSSRAQQAALLKQQKVLARRSARGGGCVTLRCVAPLARARYSLSAPHLTLTFSSLRCRAPFRRYTKRPSVFEQTSLATVASGSEVSGLLMKTGKLKGSGERAWRIRYFETAGHYLMSGKRGGTLTSGLYLGGAKSKVELLDANTLHIVGPDADETVPGVARRAMRVYTLKALPDPEPGSLSLEDWYHALQERSRAVQGGGQQRREVR